MEEFHKVLDTDIQKTWKHYRYKNVTTLLFSVLIALFLLRYEPFHQVLLNLGTWGYFGAFLAGLMWTSTFTISIGTIVILVLAESLNAVELALIAGAGAVIGDLIIFKFVKDKLVSELEPVYEKLGGNHLTKILHTKYFSWSLPVIGGAIIASPLPDEIGVSLLGISKMKTYQFMIITFIFNAIGVFLIATSAAFIKP